MTAKTRMKDDRDQEDQEQESNELKIHISRVPTKFDEAIVLRILTEQLLGDHTSNNNNNNNNNGDDYDDNDNNNDIEEPVPPPIQVELVYPRPDREGSNGSGGDKKKTKEQAHHADADDEDEEGGRHQDNIEKQKTEEEEEEEHHRGFGFVTFQSKELYDTALAMSTIKGGRKSTSTKLRTMYLRPYLTEPQDAKDHLLCYLWSQHRCPYGDDCKFTHSGPGACRPKANPTTTTEEDNSVAAQRKKRGKCFAYKKGKCNKGDDCPFSHDFQPAAVTQKSDPTTAADAAAAAAADKKSKIPSSEKDCINWKTKGKCRKGDKCPYRHDPELLKKVQEKQNKNKRKREGDDNNNQNNNPDDGPFEKKKTKQPLCVRVFGMAYDTTEEDIRAFFEGCGKIQDVKFPVFEDSGRSKGYCGIWFTSPKAVEKALELNEQELLGRWLSVQAGKMYLREWEANHDHAHSSSYDDSQAMVDTH